MKHNYLNDDTFLARWLNDELSEAELADFSASEDFHLFQKIAKKSKEFQIPEFKQEETFKKIQEKIETNKTIVKRLIPNYVYAIAAAVLLLFGLTIFMDQDPNFSTLKGEQMAYTLPDGSLVELNGVSNIYFNETDWKQGKRELKLEGEGFFKVKKGSTFSVKTTEGTVTVLGTEFNVQVVKNYLAVECYEGKVNVKNQKHETVLTPGKGIRFQESIKDSYNIFITEPNWRQNTYNYNAVPLSVVFRDLENVYKVSVNNKGVNLLNTYSGVLIMNDLEKALKVICKPMNINYVSNKKEITLTN